LSSCIFSAAGIWRSSEAAYSTCLRKSSQFSNPENISPPDNPSCTHTRRRSQRSEKSHAPQPALRNISPSRPLSKNLAAHLSSGLRYIPSGAPLRFQLRFRQAGTESPENPPAAVRKPFAPWNMRRRGPSFPERHPPSGRRFQFFPHSMFRWQSCNPFRFLRARSTLALVSFQKLIRLYWTLVYQVCLFFFRRKTPKNHVQSKMP